MASNKAYRFDESKILALRNDVRHVAMTHLHSSTELIAVNRVVNQICDIIEKEYIVVADNLDKAYPAYEEKN